MEDNFEHDEKGWIVYKVFGRVYPVPDTWNLKPGNFIEENVCHDAYNNCACGINFGSKKLIRRHYANDIVWICRINWEYAHSIIIPVNSEGKARCSRIELVDKTYGLISAE